MKLRRFNKSGFDRFVEYRDLLTTEPEAEPPFHLLEDPLLTEVIPGDVDIEQRSFDKRFDAGVYLLETVSKTSIDLPEKDAGLWSWLTLFFLDQVCPADKNGCRQPYEGPRLVPTIDNYQRFYRHLLLGPYLIVRAHHDNPERAMALLHNPLYQPGEIPSILAASKESVTNRAVVETATRLYYDGVNDKLKTGSGSKNKGAPRRLAAVLNQLDLTYYLYGLNTEELLALLPKEFDKFKS
jgi:hypothetical protein